MTMTDATNEKEQEEEYNDDDSLPHQKKKKNPFVFLEHVNLNIGTTWTPYIQSFFFTILGCFLDARSDHVLQNNIKSGSQSTIMRWANVGFQQFHLVGYGSEDCYAHLKEPAWSCRQRIHGMVGLEWMPGQQHWQELRIRLEQGLTDGVIQHYEEVFLLPSDNENEDDGCSKQPAFHIIACHGNVFQITAQQCVEEDSPYFVGPIWPPPMVNDIPFPLPTSDPKGYTIDDINDNSASTARALGMRFVEYYVPYCNQTLGSDDTSSSKRRVPLDVIQETYSSLFPGIVHCRGYRNQVFPLSAAATTTTRRQRHEYLEILVGHEKNPQYLRFTQLHPQDMTEADFHPYDGHHVAIYIDNFVESYKRAKTKNLIFENPVFPQFTCKRLDDVLKYHEFRFCNFIDQQTNTVVFTLEHEVRSLQHAGFAQNKHVWAATTTHTKEE